MGTDRPRIGSRLRAVALVTAATCLVSLGCRGHQFGHVLTDNQADMVGSHAAGAEVYGPLIDEAVAKLLARHSPSVQQVSFAPTAGMPSKRICFIGVENKSIEELGDFKDQIYQQIDTRLVECQGFEAVSRRMVDAALRESRLRPDSLFIPENMRIFTAILEKQGQPVDCLLYATLTSGTTENNHSDQRDYVLTLELVDVHTGAYDKQSAKIRKGYHRTVLGKWWKYNPLTHRK